ncbi:MAG: LacI family transcriptional regulator, partial [Rubrivivax sp.]
LEAGLDAPALLEVPFIETAVESVTAFLKREQRLTALFCSNDLLAIRSLRAAHRSGLMVPQDLSVVGFDGIALGEDLTPALSTVAQPNGEIGRRSVEIVIQALARGVARLDAGVSLLLPHTFRTGESCATTPA